MNRWIATAGVGGDFTFVSKSRSESEFPGDDRVLEYHVSPPPRTVRDKRISQWIKVVFECEDDTPTAIHLAREYLERLIDVISVCAGTGVRMYYWSVSCRRESGELSEFVFAKSISTSNRPNADITVLTKLNLKERHYRALRWLRRGLREKSPEDRFACLILAVQILARGFPIEKKNITNCPECGAIVTRSGPSEAEKIFNLSAVLPDVDKEDLKKLWKLRNAVTGHGGKHLSPEMSLKLVEAGFLAVGIAYKALKVSLGLDVEGAPNISSNWFLTDMFMLSDMGDRTHERVFEIDVIREEKSHYTAIWPVGGTMSASGKTAPLAVDNLKAKLLERSKALGTFRRTVNDGFRIRLTNG